MRATLFVFALGLQLSAVPVFAHHSFAAEFDANKTVTVKGSVTKLDWLNPHIWIYIDAKDEHDTVQHWQCEGGAPNMLLRNGWNKDSLKVGSEITIEGYLAKDGSNTCNARSVKLPDGRRIFAGSAADAPGKQ